MLRSTLIAPIIALGLFLGCSVVHAQPVSLRSLLAEMTDRDAVARFPDPTYQCLQASSYNRESVKRGEPGWFADSDGTGFIRQETVDGRTEWVVMEHTGPGAITKVWTPFFYYDFNERVGPNVRIYLDGDPAPVFDESLIRLVTGKGSVAEPLSGYTARAGNLYLPIPFAKSCKVTMAARPFYYIINYRAYLEGTPVDTFSRAAFATDPAVSSAAGALHAPPATGALSIGPVVDSIGPRGEIAVGAPPGPGAIREFSIRLPDALQHAGLLRSTVLVIECDGEQAVWCPIGDFFCSADSLHPFATSQRTVTPGGLMRSRWVMPYRQTAKVRLLNLAGEPTVVEFWASADTWTWDDRSMHFHASWRPDDVVPGTPFQDWNFIDIQGRGVYVGDAWTVLNPQSHTWWGEGDEKIYVDGAWERGFPTHFGTGTEDYYGWAGGEVPTRKDEFSQPFLANVRVGGVDGTTQGYNICTRTRSLDAIPFASRLRFDMESSFGTDIRNPWNTLGYSAVTFWYAVPGATHNRPAAAGEAAKPIMALVEGEAGAKVIRR